MVEVLVEWVLSLWFRFRWWLSETLYDGAYAVVQGHFIDESWRGTIRWWLSSALIWLGVHVQPYLPLAYAYVQVESDDDDVALEDLSEDDWFHYVQAEFPPVRAEDLR